MMLPTKYMKFQKWEMLGLFIIYSAQLKWRFLASYLASTFQCSSCQKIEGILPVFQDFLTRRTLKSLAISALKTAISTALSIGLAGCTTSVADSGSMLVNLSRSYPQIQKLITGAAVLIGFGLAMRAIYYLKVYGEMRTMMASQGNIKTPLIYLIVAAALIYLPQTINDFMLSSFGTTQITPLNYNTDSINGESLQATNAILGFIQIIGLLSFVRGWIIVAKSAQGAAQGASFGKGATHVIGGILAINIVGTKDAIWATLGLS